MSSSVGIPTIKLRQSRVYQYRNSHVKNKASTSGPFY